MEVVEEKCGEMYDFDKTIHSNFNFSSLEIQNFVLGYVSDHKPIALGYESATTNEQERPDSGGSGDRMDEEEDELTKFRKCSKFVKYLNQK